MEQFASGWKRSYYGKGNVIVYRLNRDARTPDGASPVFGASVLMLVYGDAFWETYTTGDNTGLVATDSMKNFIQRETMLFEGYDLEGLCNFLARKFLATYPQTEGIQVTATEIPYARVGGSIAFTPAGPERAFARVELGRGGPVEAVSGIRGFKLLRLGGSAFHGFVRDEYTTLPDITNRPLHMWLDLEWRYLDHAAAFTQGAAVARAREIVSHVFQRFESGSIQQVIYQMGTRILEEMPSVAEVHLEANNRTWDTVTEQGDELGVFTDARPPYGCLGLRLKRS
jgi:urate oxidase